MNRDPIDVVLIGGPADGEHRLLRERVPYLRAFVHDDLPLTVSSRVDRPVSSVTHAEYRPHDFNVDGAIFTVYVHDGLPLVDAFRRLLDNYRPPTLGQVYSCGHQHLSRDAAIRCARSST